MPQPHMRPSRSLWSPGLRRARLEPDLECQGPGRGAGHPGPFAVRPGRRNRQDVPAQRGCHGPAIRRFTGVYLVVFKQNISKCAGFQKILICRLDNDQFTIKRSIGAERASGSTTSANRSRRPRAGSFLSSAVRRLSTSATPLLTGKTSPSASSARTSRASSAGAAQTCPSMRPSFSSPSLTRSSRTRVTTDDINSYKDIYVYLCSDSGGHYRCSGHVKA
jgi:hypothetical protein